LNKTIISCHILTPRPWNPALAKRTVVYKTEVLEFIPATRMWHLQIKKNKKENSENEKMKKSVERNEGGGECEKKRHINGRMIGEMRTRKPRTSA
jgi:hypothetical protein